MTTTHPHCLLFVLLLLTRKVQKVLKFRNDLFDLAYYELSRAIDLGSRLVKTEFKKVQLFGHYRVHIVSRDGQIDRHHYHSE